MLKNNKGSILPWSIFVFIIVSLIFLAVANVIYNANFRNTAQIYRHQAFLGAKSISEIIATELELKTELGLSIDAYLKISGDCIINDIKTPKDVGEIYTEVNNVELNKIAIKTVCKYQGYENTYVVYMIQKFMLYDKDGVLVSRDYQGGLSDEELEEMYIEGYWQVSSYDKK